MIYEEFILAAHNVAKSKHCKEIVNLFLNTLYSPFELQEFETLRLQNKTGKQISNNFLYL